MPIQETIAGRKREQERYNPGRPPSAAGQVLLGDGVHVLPDDRPGVDRRPLRRRGNRLGRRGFAREFRRPISQPPRRQQKRQQPRPDVKRGVPRERGDDRGEVQPGNDGRPEHGDDQERVTKVEQLDRVADRERRGRGRRAGEEPDLGQVPKLLEPPAEEKVRENVLGLVLTRHLLRLGHHRPEQGHPGHRERGDGGIPGDIDDDVGVHAEERGEEHEDRHDRKHVAERPERPGGGLAEHDLAVPQVGHEQEIEPVCLPVLGNGGREERRRDRRGDEEQVERGP
jgi:hypothetical protein